MKRLIILIPVFYIFIFNSFSQDSIFMKDKSCILAKVTEILPEYVKYKKFNNLEGPEYTVLKTDLSKITYQNGTIDIFTTSATNSKNEKEFTTRNKKAQGFFHGGLSLSTIRGDDPYTENRKGTALGFGIDFPINQSGSSFEITLFYEEKGTAYSDIEQEVDNELYVISEAVSLLEYITISFRLKKFFGTKRLFYAKVGVYTGFRMTGEIEGEIIKISDNSTSRYNWSLEDYYYKLDAGLTCGIGVNIPISKGENPINIIVESSYNFGLTNIYVDDSLSLENNYKEFNNNFLFLAGLRFPL